LVNPFRKAYFLSRGLMVSALTLGGVEKDGRAYPPAGFRNLHYAPENESDTRIEILEDGEFTLECGSLESGNVWTDSLALTG
jgi:hypothetical protein